MAAMTADPTAPTRVARYTANMLKRGMKRVHLWVPTEADADELRLRAAEMRERDRAGKKSGGSKGMEDTQAPPKYDRL